MTFSMSGLQQQTGFRELSTPAWWHFLETPEWERVQSSRTWFAILLHRKCLMFQSLVVALKFRTRQALAFIYTRTRKLSDTKDPSYMWVSSKCHVLFIEQNLRDILDCEGLRGDSNPIASQVDVRIRKAKVGKLRKPVPMRSNTSQAIMHHTTAVVSIQPDIAEEIIFDRGLNNKPLPTSTMPLPWAEHSSKPWRSVVSEKIYPRFLYIFSDTVCYVTGNSR